MTLNHITLNFLALLLSSSALCGNHLDIMAPLSSQHDLKGKPASVTEKVYVENSGTRQLLSTTIREYDEAGNLLTERKDKEGIQSSSIYEYDEQGVWIGLRKTNEDGESRYQIFLDEEQNRIAEVNIATKETEITSFTESGYESAAITRSSSGSVTEKVTIKRNSMNKEESVIFEEPPGTKKSEVAITWNSQLFQTRSTFTLLNRGGATFDTLYEYGEVDDEGNWLQRTERLTLKSPDGGMKKMPAETSERVIQYHD